MVNEEIRNIVILTTLIFLIAPAFIVAYIFVYRDRRRKHQEEKERMRLTFETELAKTQYEVQEQTMQTIGADLHDNIGQLLSLTSVTLRSIELDNTTKAQQKIEAAVDLTLRSIKEMRQLGKLLQGDQLVAVGFDEAVRQEINWLERSGKYIVNFTPASELPAETNPDKDLILFRILQEVLNNIIKHASATNIDIGLDYKDNTLQLQIADDGVGFNAADTAAGRDGMGLSNIRKRAGLIGGNATVQSSPGKGTHIDIFIPYP